MGSIFQTPSEESSLNQLYIDYKLSPEESSHRASLMAVDNLGALLAPCLVSFSRAHVIFFFWTVFSLIEILSKVGFSNPALSGSNLMCFLYGLIGKGLLYP
ncbi:unnamed protein product [Arabidopsis thaliana]|uniref:Uncharacterized protein n=1 Tax=Arabidopsis thaliana TaxID=3702 RepID=A0A654FDF4_ARATH|nr:unnamed protein product [Arabidopsis thaliana]